MHGARNNLLKRSCRFNPLKTPQLFTMNRAQTVSVAVRRSKAMTVRRLRIVSSSRRLAQAEDRGGILRIAFATQDFETVDAHFGWAKNIVIHEISPISFEFVEVFQFAGEPREDGDEDKLQPKLNAIEDSSILYVAAIGGSGAARVIAQNMHPIMVPRPEKIVDLLEKLKPVLNGSPPPWLRKVLSNNGERRFEFDEDIANA
jgi:nitrogen fixation protein NifX